MINFPPDQTKNPMPKNQHGILAGILATLFKVGCNSLKSAHLIHSFLNFYLHFGGDLCLKLKKPPKGGINIPFAISTSWILALAPLGPGCRTGYEPDLFPSLFMIYVEIIISNLQL